jgi:hypothetical protein
VQFFCCWSLLQVKLKNLVIACFIPPAYQEVGVGTWRGGPVRPPGVWMPGQAQLALGIHGERRACMHARTTFCLQGMVGRGATLTPLNLCCMLISLT